MIKYFKFETISILCFILLFIVSRILPEFLKANELVSAVMIILFMANIFVILVVIPAMALLSFRDKVLPKGISHNNFSPMVKGINYWIINIAFVVLIYISLSIYKNILITSLLLVVWGLIFLFSILFSDKTKK